MLGKRIPPEFSPLRKKVGEKKLFLRVYLSPRTVESVAAETGPGRTSHTSAEKATVFVCPERVLLPASSQPCVCSEDCSRTYVGRGLPVDRDSEYPWSCMRCLRCMREKWLRIGCRLVATSRRATRLAV